MNYDLNQKNNQENKISKSSIYGSWKSMWLFLKSSQIDLIWAGVAIILNSVLNLMAPVLIGQAVDRFISQKLFDGVLVYSAILLVLFILAFLANYLQTIKMGTVGQKALYELRNAIFTKLQDLPIAFFNQNKAGDLISRINNDSDKLNQFFSQTLMQFVGNIFIMIGAAILLLVINPLMGLVALIPTLFLLIFTRLVSPWVKNRNALSLQNTGGMSAEIQESLDNFKVIAAYNRRDYFQKQFDLVNKQNYQSAILAGMANNIFIPTYGLLAHLGQFGVLMLGLYLIGNGQFTIGWLVSYLAYVNIFYTPLRQMAALWAGFQVALAGWDRIVNILELENNLLIEKNIGAKNISTENLITFKNVSFAYPNSKEVLSNINFNLKAGKTYAFVGPTGGGKTTTASLMARLYDPTNGTIYFGGRDIRSYKPEERTQKIGYILQEPFLFTGSLRENIVYGNNLCQDTTPEKLMEILRQAGLKKLLDRFNDGLETQIKPGDDSVSHGQKQLIAFIQVVLRQPDLLILDEATANIDTMTEQLLQEILDKLPKKTTRVIIAHRLNTIAKADVIFFVNNGRIVEAGSMEQAVDMLIHEQRKS